MLTRRSFCKGAVGLSALGMSLPTVFQRAVLAAGLEHGEGADTPSRTLVVVQLAGGNDGLNTVVPYADANYGKARGRIGLKADQVLKLDQSFGLHPQMAKLKEFWDAGTLAIVQGVGYPEPN